MPLVFKRPYSVSVLCFCGCLSSVGLCGQLSSVPSSPILPICMNYQEQPSAGVVGIPTLPQGPHFKQQRTGDSTMGKDTMGSKRLPSIVPGAIPDTVSAGRRARRTSSPEYAVAPGLARRIRLQMQPQDRLPWILQHLRAMYILAINTEMT